MVLRNQIEQHSGLFLYTGIEFFTTKCLIDLPYTALDLTRPYTEISTTLTFYAVTYGDDDRMSGDRRVTS